jgi:hypothetical protein
MCRTAWWGTTSAGRGIALTWWVGPLGNPACKHNTMSENMFNLKLTEKSQRVYRDCEALFHWLSSQCFTGWAANCSVPV